MREIKFRAWITPINEMRTINNVDFNGDTKHFIVSDTNHDSWYRGDYKIMQYTGLKDKNGTEIYEGDLFELESVYLDFVDGKTVTVKDLIAVTFARGSYVLYERGIGYHCLYDVLRGFSDSDTSDIWGTEISGNIYENPELLRGDTD